MMTTGFLPNESSNLYRVNPKHDLVAEEDKSREEDDLRLIGTAEVPLIGQHVGETFAAEELPKRYV